MEPLHKDGVREISLLDFLGIIIKRKTLIIRSCVFAAVVSIVYSLTLPNIYSSTARVLPPQKEGGTGLSALLSQAGGLAGLAAGSLGGGSDLYIGILKSRSVADAVIRRMGLMTVYEKKTLDETRRALAQTVKVSAGKDGIIDIVAEDEDPKRSAQLANAFVDELGRTAVRLNLSKAGTERLFLEKRLELVKKELKAAEDSVKAFAQDNKIVNVESQAKASVEGLARMKTDLMAREVQLSVLRTKQTDESAEVKALESGIRKLRNEIGRSSGNDSDTEVIPAVGNVPGVGLQYSRKMRELKMQEAIFEQLTKQYEVAKLNEARDSSTLQILDEAVIPLKKSKPSRSLLVLMATAAALFISVIAAFFMEYLENMPEEERRKFKSMLRLQLPQQ